MDKRVLVFDIENAFFVVKTFGIRDQYLAPSQIVRDTWVMAIAAKWLGDPPETIMYKEARKPRNERALLLWIRKLLNKAEIVVTQNGKNFDSKVLNARFMLHHIKPPKPYKHLDTLLIARSVARFPSNKLEYLTEKLCVRYRKLNHSAFPGKTLWDECEAGNPKAWAAMKRYNIHDVLSTEELYMTLRAWAPMSAPKVYEQNCETCGSSHGERRGIETLRTAKYVRWHCLNCGRWQRGAKL